MYIFVWEWIENLTDNYHSGGGLTVVAENLDRAKVIACKEGVSFSKKDSDPVAYALADTHEEKVFVFPDAGCC